MPPLICYYWSLACWPNIDATTDLTVLFNQRPPDFKRVLATPTSDHPTTTGYTNVRLPKKVLVLVDIFPNLH